MTRFNYDHFDGYNSSDEILAAIEEIASDEFEAGNDETECHRIWAEPTADEMAKVAAIAWTLADPDEDVLHWGSEKLRRK